MNTGWQHRWNPKARWKGTKDFLAYRDELVGKTLQLVAEWKHQRRGASRSGSRNQPHFCARLEMLADECGTSLPPPTGADIDELAWDLADYLSILSETDCWDLHVEAVQSGQLPPPVCGGCPFGKPVKGWSGDRKYYGCDVLAFIGQKIVEWRAGLPSDPWPEPGVWYSAFETDRSRH